MKNKKQKIENEKVEAIFYYKNLNILDIRFIDGRLKTYKLLDIDNKDKLKVLIFHEED